MDVEAFQAMTRAEAVEYLAALLRTERKVIGEVSNAAHESGVKFDYSLESLPECLKWLMRQARMHSVPLPPETPDWIRSSRPQESMEFDEASKSILLRGGYYLGECFARIPKLRWQTGDPEYMHCNMPVVAGFQGDQELPPLLVFENLCARVIELGHSESVFDSVIQNWRQSVRGE